MRPRLQELQDRATAPGAFAALALVGGLLLALVVRIRIGGHVEAPLLVCDEFIYAELAQSFADEGRLLLRGEPSYQSLIYPILLAPAWLADSAETAYELAKMINAGLLAAAAVFVYLWGRGLMSPGWALLAPTLVLLMPAQLYSGLILSENAFLPAFVLATYAIARAIELPSKQRQLFALVAIAVACGVRIQGVVLLVILPTAVLAAGLLETRLSAAGQRLRTLFDGLRAWWPSAAMLAGAACAYVIVQLARGESFAEAFGSYEAVITRGYTVEGEWQFGRLHLAALALSVGLVPLSALVVLAARAILHPERASAGHRSLMAVATASTFWIAVEVGLFTSQFVGSIAERYIFYVSPVLFLVLAVWLAEGLPRRPWLATAAGALLPGALVVSEPLMPHLGPGLLINSFTLFGFFGYTDDLGGADNLVWAWRLGALVAAVSFAALWRPLARVLIPAGIAVFFIVMQRPGDELLVQHSTGVRLRPGIGGNPSWIDNRVGRDTPVDFLYAPRPDEDAFDSTTIMLQLKFWNRSLQSIVNVGPREVCPLPERGARIDLQSGRITVPGRAVSHLVVEDKLRVAGTVLTREGPFVLYRVARPLSLPALTTDGVFPDGWTGAEASFTQYRTRGRPGRAMIEISRAAWTGPDVPGNVTVQVGRFASSGAVRWTASRRLVIHSGETRSLSLLTPKSGFRVRIKVDPTFSPSAFGLPDARQLGVQVRYRFVR